MFAIADSRVIPAPEGYVSYSPGEVGLGVVVWGGLVHASGNPMTNNIVGGHGASCNVVACEGHISLVNSMRLFHPSIPNSNARNWNNDNQPHAETWKSIGE